VFRGRSWQADSFGKPRDVLRVKQITWPAPDEGQVLVKVRACGVGLPDLLMTTGQYPFCAGLGAGHTVNYRTSDLVNEVKTMTGGKGADVIFDPVGGDLGTGPLPLLRAWAGSP
jgi:NADPH:quinone reductase-like Zn-dependent oxidoreductase